jgi:predicted O-linked N-acetylglucosamine transferase (SPINDLY family)
VGYVSPDFRDHSVAYFIEPVLAHHDARQFEIFAYHTAATTDAVTARMRATVPGWRDCMRDTDVQLAERIRDDGIDVLVDLAGHTANHRLLTFARKPAPVQASWIGYPSTTGVPQIDYRITDPVASPPVAGGDGDSEAFFRLSVAFSCYRPPEGIPRTEPVQDSAEEVITLGSFNTLAKMSDTTIRLWSAVLRKRKNFALLLKDKAFCDASTRARLLERFSEQGVDPSRIRLLARSRTTRDHLAQYSAIDIALDTYPYCGVTTTCEALWMGVPVISLAGDDFASRMGASLLSAAGQDQWVARDPDDFARIVLEVADAPAARARWRRELRTMIDASQLRDEAGVTCAVESAYRTMWQSWCASQVPRA